MRLLTFAYPDDPQPSSPPSPHLGAVLDETVIDLEAARQWATESLHLTAEDLPDTMFELIHAGPHAWDQAREILNFMESAEPQGITTSQGRPVSRRLEDVVIYPPLVRPMSLRDFYAFEAHVAAARENRGQNIPPEWYQFPVFYFSNPNSIFGHSEVVPYPSYTEELDYELEIACIIGKPGINIPASEAEEYIFGYTIFNDWSARDAQRLEMRVGLGPAKGKDFASSLGPWITTPDELAGRATGRPGVFDLAMVARVNGQERSRGNWKDIYYSFGQMIERASQDTYLLPGDIIGSGTVGSGCLLELTRGEGPWLQTGDVVELEVERIGILRNRVGKPHEIMK